MRIVGQGSAESPPSEQAARPITLARGSIAHERLIRHRLHTLPFAVAVAVVRNARARAASGARQDEQASMPVDEGLETAGFPHDAGLPPDARLPPGWSGGTSGSGRSWTRSGSPRRASSARGRSGRGLVGGRARVIGERSSWTIGLSSGSDREARRPVARKSRFEFPANRHRFLMELRVVSQKNCVILNGASQIDAIRNRMIDSAGHFKGLV